MVLNQIKSLIKIKGYDAMTSNIPFITFYTKHEIKENMLNVIGVIDSLEDVNINVETLDNISYQIERKFLILNYSHINIMYLIFTSKLQLAKSLIDAKSKFWIIDNYNKNLVIYENQPENFDDLKEPVEQLIKNYEITQITNKKIHRKNFPLITLTIVILNIVAFIFLEANGSTFDQYYMIKKGAAVPNLIFENHEYYRLFTCVFMHFGFAHLMNNMISLWVIGIESERFYGKISYVFIYLVSGVGASLCSALYNYSENNLVISAGASGAIFGIFGSLVVMAFEQKHTRIMSLTTRIVLVVIILFMGNNGEENIDNVAHIGGFVVGLIFSLIIYKIRRNKTQFS